MPREANRSVVEHAPILFAAADFRLISAEHGAQSVALSDAELELLARVEHRRWMADRINKGWRYSKTQDDRMLLHPDLVPYESLSENNKEKDRNSVRVLLSALRGQGMAIVRSASIMELPPNRQPS